MTNSFEFSEDGKTITIWLKRRKGKPIACLVDASDLPKLQTLRTSWHASWCRDTNGFYVHGNVKVDGKWKTLLIHRFLLDAPRGLQVDHKFHDSLDNRRENLKVVTQSQNMMNRRGAARNSKTGHRGIFPYFGRFRLKLTINGKNRCVGFYDTIEEALTVRNAFPEYAAIM